MYEIQLDYLVIKASILALLKCLWYDLFYVQCPENLLKSEHKVQIYTINKLTFATFLSTNPTHLIKLLCHQTNLSSHIMSTITFQ